jgi:hypothetical protein
VYIDLTLAHKRYYTVLYILSQVLRWYALVMAILT